jgi:hypothetical protein
MQVFAVNSNRIVIRQFLFKTFVNGTVLLIEQKKAAARIYVREQRSEVKTPTHATLLYAHVLGRDRYY